MRSDRDEPNAGTGAVWAIGVVVALNLSIHLLSDRRYGYMGDELYYLACARHPALGYVDHPPLSIWVLGGWVTAFGDGLFALRLLPALAGAATVIVTAQIARKLGGGTLAQLLAATAAAISPVYLAVHGFYSMNAFDVLLWAVALSLIIDLSRTPTKARWLWLGVVLGLGLLNKLSVLWLGVGISGALVATPLREQLRTPGPWLAGGVAAMLFLPFVIWQVHQGYPTLEWMHAATTHKMLPVSFGEFWRRQLVVMHPFLAPVWLTGLLWLLFSPEGRRHRGLAFIYLIVAGILIANGTSRANYLAPAYPPLFAAGAIAIERASCRPRLRWLGPSLVVLLMLTGVGGAPLAVPLLPPSQLVDYQRAIGLEAPAEERSLQSSLPSLPAHLSDRLGWPELVEAVGAAWRALPEKDRQRASILAHDYSTAGAIDQLGPGLGLPPVLCTHNSYWHWRSDPTSGEILLIVGGAREDIEVFYASVEQVGTFACDYCRPNRRSRPLWLARAPRQPVDAIWNQVRHYN